MSDPKPKTEPTMDEILATVRRIIAEDESGNTSASASAPIVSSDVLELTEALEPDGSVRHIEPFGGSSGHPSSARVPPLLGERIEPAPPRSATAAEIAGRQESQGPSAEANGGAGQREPRVDAPSGGDATITQPGAAAREAIPEGEARLGGGDRTLDGIARELLRPMLQRWLEENLQGIVEQEVRSELARAAAVEPGIEPAQRRPTRVRRTAPRE